MTSFNGWADAWGNSWGSGDPNDMSGSASFSISAVLTVNVGEMVGEASMSFTASLTLPLPSIEMVHGAKNASNKDHKPHKIPTYEDYLKSTAQEDREYLDKLYKVDEATLEVLNKEAKTLVQIENIYHNTEQDREKLRQALIEEGIAYRDAYLEVYTGLVNEYRQAQEDEAIAAVIAAML